ncbi:MAG: efflux RND transporter periplasmic adaptor subunit [Deltaproteobacteria bacterium]|nr:efflux RND transporter periplasmic adaptor subunit [Deltaproteobacteria bacterium]
MSRHTVQKIIGWVLVLTALGLGVFAWQKYGRERANAEPRFRTTKAEKGRIASKVTATGTLSARVTVQVGSQVSGRIAELFVDFNSPVTKGMVLAKIDPRMLQAALRKARAAVAQASASVAKAKANNEQAVRAFERAKNLKAQGLMGQADYDLAETAVNATKADIAVAQAQLEAASASANEADVNLGFTTIISPIDGIVLSRAIDVGQTVAASLQSPTLFTIAKDLRSIQVDTFVAEADVGKLTKGMEATFTVDAYPGIRFRGTIREVRNAAQTVQNVVTYDAVLDVQNDELKLKPGMTANVTFVWAEKNDVLKIPNAALRFRPPPEALSPPGSGSGRRRGPSAGGSASAAPSAFDPSDPTRRTVWVLRDGAPHPVRVEVGVTDGTSTEVVSGRLEPGDEVITEYVAPADGAPAAATGSARLPGTGGGGGGRGGRMF